MRVSLDVPAAWGMRAREAGGRALRPCQVSPSSPSELFLLPRPRCTSSPCNDHERLIDDLESAGLALSQQLTSSASQSLGAGANITRLAGTTENGMFSAFRLVRTDPQTSVPVACEAFLFADERSFEPAYEAACMTLRISPEDWEEGPEEIAAAPDGEPRSEVQEMIARSAVGYLTSLASRDARTANLFLRTSSECVAAGGERATCEEGMNERASALRRSLDTFPTAFVAGAVDVRSPASLPGLVIATVKRHGDPCGPGYELTLAPGQGRYTVVSPEPTPDPRLEPPSR